jgi:hypothetical protein
MDLELSHGLDPDFDEHMWLLHYLFLDAVNHDAVTWAESWNRHSLRHRYQRQRSPRDIFFFDSIQGRLRGHLLQDDEIVPTPQTNPEEDELALEDIPMYGIDWEDLNDATLLHHHEQHNPHQLDNFDTPVFTHQPNHLSLVEVPEFACPLSEDEAQIFEEAIATLPELHSDNLTQRKSLWIAALGILTALSA